MCKKFIMCVVCSMLLSFIIIGCGKSEKDTIIKNDSLEENSEMIFNEIESELMTELIDTEISSVEQIDTETTEKETTTNNSIPQTIEYTYSTTPKSTYAVFVQNTNIYDTPNANGNVIDTFGYKHLMISVEKCNETGWLKVIYDDVICAESNYENHVRVLYDYNSITPAATPDDDYYIIFSKQAKNIKTGYINPKDIKHPQAWEDEVYHIWNGIKYYETYHRSEERNNYFKQLCYVDRYTIVEHDHSLGMFILDPDESYETTDAMFEAYANERGYLLNGGGGCWIDSEAPAYYIYADFLTLEEQYCEVNSTGDEIGYLINWEYMKSNYGYDEEAIWLCASYVGSIICDKSIGTWNENSVRYNAQEFVQVCRAMDEFNNSDRGKLPTIRNIPMRTIRYVAPQNGGSIYEYYYLYLETDDEATIEQLDKQLYEQINDVYYSQYSYEETTELYGEYQEGKVYKKKIFFPDLYRE